MGKPAKIVRSEVALPSVERIPLQSIVEIAEAHGIEDGATCKAYKFECLNEKKLHYRWKSQAIRIRRDIVTDSATKRTFLKVRLTLTIEIVDESCEVNAYSPGPGDVTITITNYPPEGGDPEPSDPEEVNPIYFP